MKRLIALGLFALCITTRARAGENLVSGLSQDTIQITSSYSGTDIVVFGAIERPDSDTKHDIAVVVRGPATDMRVRQKSRVAGIWVNSGRVILRSMPGYYFLASTKPLAQLASAETLRQYSLGLDALMPHSVTGPDDTEAYRQALLRFERKAGLYRETPNGVRFLSGTLFRAHVALPASAPRGQYTAEVYLLRDGRVIGARSSPLSIDQTGLERQLFDFAYRAPFAYGLSTVLMAVLLGWLSSLAFRRME